MRTAALFILLSLGLWHVCLSAYPGYSPKVKPSYCNEDPSQSKIAPLTADQLKLVSSLKAVQVMVRHGARTPWGLEPCWQNYDVSWNDCNVTELMIASPAPVPYNSQVVPEPWLFRKVYDAFPGDLGGENCYTGQLLSKGYDQEQENGRILSKQYLQQKDPKFNLFPSDDWTTINQDVLFLRSDDEQRTLMSGQTVLSTFFNVTKENIVTWHTGDIDLDQIAPNTEACPALNGVQLLATNSQRFQSKNNSESIVDLTHTLDGILGAGYWTWYNVIDCFMTTVCTDREIPANPVTGAVVNDDIFNATITQVEYQYAFISNYNDSRFSKLGMGHTIYEMRTRLQQAVDSKPGYVKFGLWSAHDTSIMPLLSALLEYEGGNLWDGRWAQYAALVTIELYEAVTGGNLFRLIYNGKPLSLPACAGQTLCSVNALLDAMAFAQDQMPCTALPVDPIPTPTPAVPPSNTNGNAELGGMTETGWTGLVILAALVGAFVGALVVTLYHRRQSQKSSDAPFQALSMDDNGSGLHQNLVPSGAASDQKNPLRKV